MSRSSRQARREAERWFGRMVTPTCTAADQLAFEEWRAVAEHADAYAEVELLWGALGKLSGRTDLEQLSSQVLAESAAGVRPLFGEPLRWSLAAGVLVCLVAAGAFVGGRYYTPTRTYTTEAAQRSTIRLADGSEVTLNAGTRLQVKLGKRERRFVLRQGEALFVVAQDPARPFTVSAGDGEVRALGTRFAVRNERRQVIVTLLEGRIALDRAKVGQHLELKTGEEVRFTAAASTLTRRMVDPELVASWTTGRLRFRAAPLSEVVSEVNRYSELQISIGAASLSSIPVSGTFEIGNSASVVRALESLLSVDAQTRGANEIVLVPK